MVQFPRKLKKYESKDFVKPQCTAEIKVYGDVANSIVFKKPVSKHYVRMCFLRLMNAIYNKTVRSRKSKLTAVGIRCADHATPSIRKS
jgi:hypothetical protein